MSVYAWSRSLTPDRAAELDIGYCATLEELIDRCRIVSLHTALTGETRGFFNRARIARMQKNAVLINTARAELVEEDALVEALQAGSIRAGLDVLAGEPDGKSGEVTSPLRDCPGIVLTHHIGASTTQAQDAVAAESVRIIGEYRRSGQILNWVNRSPATPVTCQLVVRHYDKPGVLANVLRELKDAEINAEEVENVIFAGNRAASCTIKLSSYPSEAVLSAIRSRTDQIIGARLLAIEEAS